MLMGFKDRQKFLTDGRPCEAMAIPPSEMRERVPGCTDTEASSPQIGAATRPCVMPSYLKVRMNRYYLT